MGRGSKQQRKLAEQQLKLEQQKLASAEAERREAKAALLPKLEELGRPYSPEEEAAIVGRTMESADAGFGAGIDQMRRLGARTRNVAGIPANIRELTRERARTKSDLARGIRTGIADEAHRRKSTQAQMLASLYGIDTNLLGQQRGLPYAALGAHSQGISQGFSLGPLGRWG
jgi:hypothetical protein